MEFSDDELIFSRFSVVDSMLSSINQQQDYGAGGSSGTDRSVGHDFYSSAAANGPSSFSRQSSVVKNQPTTSNTGRRRGHTQSSSMSSYDTNAHVDDIARGYAEYHAKGRPVIKQSNSSRPLTGIKTNSYGVNGTIVAGHTRSVTRGSKGSGSSSVDLGYKSFGMNNMAPKQIPHRAASFDHGYSPSKPFAHADVHTGSGKGSPVPIDYTSFDAAPTPTIPAGPRRPSEPLSPLIASPIMSQDITKKSKPVPSRRNSVKSSTGKSVKKVKSSAPVNIDIRDQAREFVQYSNNNARNAPTAINASAPSPTVGTIRRPQQPQNPPPPPPKDSRPGFFRKIFGGSSSSRNVTHYPREEDLAHRPPSPAKVHRKASLDANANRPRTQPNQQIPNMQFKTSSRPPTQDPSMMPRDIQPPLPLRKAHSSFFRRRKKSISDNGPPPVPVLNLQKQQSLNIASPQKSPGVSSLTAAMTPYLDQDVGPRSPLSPQDMFFEAREQPSNGTSPVDNYKGFPTSIADGLRRSLSRQGARPEQLGDVRDLPLGNTTTIRAVKPQGVDRENAKVTGTFENGSFLKDDSSNEAMDNSSVDAADDLGIVMKKNAEPRTSSSRSRGHDMLGVQRANIGEKREKPMLSPISDRSHQIDPADRVSDAEDDALVMSSGRRGSERQNSAANNRGWLDPSSSDEKLNEPLRLRLPLEGPRTHDDVSPTSEPDLYVSASSLPTVQVGGHKVRMSEEYIDFETAKAVLGENIPVELTISDRERAQKIFDGDEEFVSKAGAAAWLGQTTALSTRTRRAYMELFDWTGLNILAAFRQLCERLVLRAESQELDRVIEDFSTRWCASNTSHGFKHPDVVHTITFSILMLNTDLHIADIDTRMTRSQFVKNTLPTIRSMADASAPTEFDGPPPPPPKGRSPKPGEIAWNPDDGMAVDTEPAAAEKPKRRPSIDLKRNRLSIRPPMRNDSYDETSGSDGCNILVKAPCNGSMKDWETQIEIVLREFYNSIRGQRLPLHGHNTTAAANLNASESSQPALSVLNTNLRRTPSVLSKAPSETPSHRGRSAEHSRFNTGRFGGKKNQSRPRVYPSSTIGSSRTSLDDNSVWSPAASTWSKYSLGKTQTSTMSVESFGSHFPNADYQKAIGFANALSQAIIREEGMGAHHDEAGRVVPLLDDDTLELIGPPWAKEGIVKHKHHLESLEKKAKDRNWAECFAVIEKGWIKMFSFSSGKATKSMRARAKSRAGGGGGNPVGGGNWTENAELLSEFLLRQTIASALPAPGYSKSRPHVFALSLPTGAVHLFQVGTADIVKEFVSTANYWSARLSKPPLVGGVSNIEYGWGENVLNPALLLQRPESATPGQTPGTSSSNHSGLMGRSSINTPSSPSHVGRDSHGGGVSGRRSDDVSSIHGGYKMRLPGDKVSVSEWAPPTQSMMASQLMEVDQLRELTAYVDNVEEDLKKHNDLRPLMGMAFSPRHPNATKAMANWEKKSAYLLREIVKFKTYVDSLVAAQKAKEVILQEREERAKEKAARQGSAGGEEEQGAGEASVGDADADVPPVPKTNMPTNLNLKAQGDVAPPLNSPTTGLMLDAMPMPPGTSSSA